MSALASAASRPMLLFLLLLIVILVASNCLQVEALSAPKILSSPLLFHPLPNLYILGTVHIGSESAEEAEALIEHVGPDTVIVEVGPSRLERLQKRKQTSGQQASSESNNATTSMSSNVSSPMTMTTETEKQQQTSFSQAILSLPAFIDRGLSAGGLPGLLFALVILWPSLVKRSLTTHEEKDSLPRRDEFAAAIDATPDKSKIVAADWELDELIVKMATALSPIGWIQLGANSASIAVGLRPVDPIRRLRGESIADWAKRRRLPETSRKSKQHGEAVSPQLHQVLVHERDEQFARLCLEEATYNG